MTLSALTLDCFRRAGHSHLRSAEHILGCTKNASKNEPAQVPASASYLAHVALECALKAHLLARGGYASAEVLREKAPDVHDALFKGKSGHDLAKLAEHLRLEKVMSLAGQRWLDDDTWKRMAVNERPYSLRYGVERIKLTKVEEELKRASQILSALLSGIHSVPLNRLQRRRRR